MSNQETVTTESAATAATDNTLQLTPVETITIGPEPTALPELTLASDTDAVAETTATASPTAMASTEPDNGGGAAGWLWIAAILLLAAAVAALVVLKFGKKTKAKGDGPTAMAKTVKPAAKAASVEAIGATEATAAMPVAALPAYAVGCAQTIGGRPYQEDSYGAPDWRNPAVLASRGLLGIMADGVGGLNNGQAASGAVVRGMLNIFSQQDPNRTGSNRLLEMAAYAQSEVLKLNQQGSASGSTLVSVLIKDNEMNFISVGDSRIALYRAGGLLTLNREHVLGRESDEDAAMGRGAAVTDERRRKAITSYMGKEKLTLIDRNVQPIKLMPGDKVLLMSDGVFGSLDDQTIISKLRLPPEQAAKAIVQAVDERQLPHQDNATIVVIGIG